MALNSIDALAQQLGAALLSSESKVTTAESCTGGGIAEAITRIAGSSAWFEAGFVTYSNAQKTKMLGVPENLFTTVGAVSEEVVIAMAKGALAQSGADFSVAVSGIAGPDGGTAEKPVGTVWLAWATRNVVITERADFKGDRTNVREQTVVRALEKLVELCVA